jgi:flagellar hook-associated protein 2
MTTINTLANISAKTGIGGLASGMDIDELVKSMTATSRQKIAREQQSVQTLQWKQSAYRTVTKALSEFQKSYLDLLSATNFRSASFFSTTKAIYSSSAVSVIPTNSAKSSNITIDYIKQLASSQKISSGTSVSKSLSGTIESQTAGTLEGEDISNLLDSIGGKSISLTLDGKLRTVTFDSSFVQSVNANPTGAGLENALQEAVDKAFGVTKPQDRIIKVSVDGDKLSFNAEGSEIKATAVGGDTATLEKLGLRHEQSNRLSLYTPLSQLQLSGGLSSDETFKFSINSIDFEFDRSKSLADIMREINASDAGVTMSYSSISDIFTLTAKETGAGDNIRINQTEGNLLSALGLTAEGGAAVTEGKNAILSINGIEIVRSSNMFSVDGVGIELHETTKAGAAPINITIQEDSSALMEPIKKFLDDYNALIDLINGLISEKPDPKYPPLTEEQKSDMTEKQIEQWESKAKVGLLRGDPVLKNLLSDLRSSMSGVARSGGISLYEMGISSGGYADNGKLKINDEGKLIQALKTRGSDIAELFTAAETGLSNKVNNVIQKAIKSTGDLDTRGSLIRIAGIELSTSDTQNNISKIIEESNKRIAALQLRLTANESRLWKQFTAMETALSRMNVQSAILMQFSSNGQ